jgi:hypothetical protein
MSSGDIVNLFKLPIGAVVVDVTTRFTATAATTAQFGVGDDSVTERYMASISAPGVTRATAGVPFSYSWVGTVRAYVTGSTSNSTSGGTMRVTVLYKMDDPLITN